MGEGCGEGRAGYEGCFGGGVEGGEGDVRGEEGDVLRPGGGVADLNGCGGRGIGHLEEQEDDYGAFGGLWGVSWVDGF